MGLEEEALGKKHQGKKLSTFTLNNQPLIIKLATFCPPFSSSAIYASNQQQLYLPVFPNWLSNK